MLLPLLLPLPPPLLLLLLLACCWIIPKRAFVDLTRVGIVVTVVPVVTDTDEVCCCCCCLTTRPGVCVDCGVVVTTLEKAKDEGNDAVVAANGDVDVAVLTLPAVEASLEVTVEVLLPLLLLLLLLLFELALEFRITRIDCDFSKRFNVCKMNGPLAFAPESVVVVVRRLPSVLYVRLGCFWMRNDRSPRLPFFIEAADCSSTDSNWFALIGVCKRMVFPVVVVWPWPPVDVVLELEFVLRGVCKIKGLSSSLMKLITSCLF